MNFNDQTILVAGCSGLLGANLVARLLKEEASVIAFDLDLNSLENHLNSLDINDDRLTVYAVDITNEAKVRDLFGSIIDKNITINGAVNCTYPRNKTYGNHFFDVSMDSFNENTSLHLGSSFLFMRECAAYFNKNRSSFSLVNIASIYGCVAPNFDIYDGTNMTVPVEYAAIKSAVLHLAKYVSAYIQDSRFRVNSISPGGILDGQPLDFIKSYKKNTRGKGMLGPQDVVGSILFLLSDQSQYITGQNLIIDDGFTL